MSGFDLSNFIASFFDEARERLSSINQALVEFENGTLSEEGLVELRRDAHTIKGSALMLGVTDVGNVAHVFEDLVEALIKHEEWRTPVATQFLYDMHDMLDHRLEDPEGKELLDVETVRKKNDEVLSQLKSGGGASAPVEKKAPVPINPLAEEINAIEDVHQPEPEMDLVIDQVNEDEEISLDSIPFTSELTEDLADDEQVLSDDFSLVFDDEQEIDLSTLEDSLDDELNNLEVTEDIKPQPVAVEQPKAKEAIDKPKPEIAAQSAETELQSEFRPAFTGETKKGSGQRKSSGRFLRVDAERLEGLSHQVIEMSTEQSRTSKTERELLIAQSEMRNLRREWLKVRNILESQSHESARTIDKLVDFQNRKLRTLSEEARFQAERNTISLHELRDQVLGLMLRPLDSVFSTFPRAVRDIAAKIGKRVNLVVHGQTVEMDQGVADSLVEPLVHLLNNAVAHGIEDADKRIKAGKPEVGQVTIVANQNGNEVRIEVIDDGKGIDVETIKRVAVERGVTTQDEINLMDNAEVMEMIFRPGFSTHESVDTLAGRGIGMNVVQDTVRRLTGTIRIQSEVGLGTKFIISVPVSVAVQQALMFKIGGQQYGMLTHMIEQAVSYNKNEIVKGAAGKKFLNYGSYQVPLVDLRALMLIEGEELSLDPHIIIAEHIEGFVGIVVDEILGDGEIMVRALDPYIKRYQPQGLMGNTIAEDGSVVLLLEPYGIKEMGRTSPDQTFELEVAEEDKLYFRVLLVDDSFIAREIEKNIFETLGFVVETAIDGMDALEKLELGTYDMIVTDLEMPRLDGFGLVRRVRNQSQYEEMPVMVISTRESPEDRVRALEAGADSYLVKQHLDGDNIIATVKGLVGPLMVKERGIAQELNTAA